MTEEEKRLESNNFRIIITAVISCLLGASIILAMILFGMNVQKKINDEKEESAKAEKIYSIISVDYSTASFDYDATKSVKSDGSRLNNYLISLYDSALDQNYFVIDSMDKLNDVMTIIRNNSENKDITYDIDDKFFNSSSIIMVTAESDSLTSFDVKTVTRDEDYNIQIDATEHHEENNCEKTCVAGRAVFVKIRNIQPINVTVNIEKD